jgi:diguanylate cyclase (GGDEF)-like protein/PAS domain S-box-containing protein
MRKSRLLAAYVGTMGLLALLYLVWPTGSAVLVSAVGVVSAAAIVAGVRRYRPQRAVSWLMLAASLVANAAARILYDALPGAPGTLKPDVWLVWLIHLVMFVLLCAGVVGMVRGHVRGSSAAIDTLIILLSAGLLLGLLIAIPYASVPGIDPVWAAARVAYVARDVLVLALAALLAIAVQRNASTLLLQTGLLSLVVYDVVFRVGRIRGDWLEGTQIEVLWLLFFIAIGAAALVPSMVAFDRRGPAGQPQGHHLLGTRVRLGLVLVATLVPSAALFAGLFRPPPWYQGMLVATATAVLVLTFARMLDVSAQLREQVRGERVVRDAMAEFADVHDELGITAVLDRAIGKLIRPGRDYGVTLAAASHAFPPDFAIEAPTPGSPGHSDDDGRLSDTTALPADVAAALGAPGPMLALAVRHPSEPPEQTQAMDADQPRRRVLLVRSDLASLRRLRPRLAALATQAGLATERIRLNDQLMRHTREEYFRTLVQKSTDIILILDDQNRIRYATPSAASLTGPRTLTGVDLMDLVDPVDRNAVSQLLDETRARVDTPALRISAGPVGRADWTVQTHDGRSAHVEAFCRDLRGDPSIDGLVLTLRDVTEQLRLQRELADRAFHDPLTGLSNRLPFSERLDHAVRQRGVAELAGVICVDLDDLKLINDGLGHEAGDAVLTAIADRLREFLAGRPGHAADMASRVGGDEFAVLLTGLTGWKDMELATDALTDELSRPIHIGGDEVLCTSSAGVATTLEADNAQDLLRNADLALYAAKGTGKRQWRRYQPWMRNTLNARLALRTALDHAIENNEFYLEYQPIVALHDQSTVGFEALLRWHHPTRGRLTPDQFIDVAEESGLIAPIGQWVLATAFNAANRWHARTGTQPYVGVNVSVRQFRSARFAGTVRRLLAESGLPPNRAMIEITESLLLREDDQVWLDLQRLRAAGVRIAIDDFGTGYSALSYLRQVPLDVVKLDRSFITSIIASEQQHELVQGIVGLAGILDLEVIAEGIETHDEYAAIKRAGCGYGQGFLFSPPMTDDAVQAWIAESENRRAAAGVSSGPQ